jgi:hypothetical protein
MVAENVEHLNRQLAETERNVIRFGIGINGGEVIIGDIGYGENIAFTALGDAVNVAARLQDMSKELECEVVISDEVYQTAGLPHEGVQLKEITVRGRAAPIVVRTVLKAENLATLFERAKANSMAAASTHWERGSRTGCRIRVRFSSSTMIPSSETRWRSNFGCTRNLKLSRRRMAARACRLPKRDRSIW